MPLNDEKKSLVDRFKDMLRAQLPNANGRLPGKVVGTGPADDVKKARDALPLFLRIFGVLPCFDKTQPRRVLHARKVRRAGQSRKNQYKDLDGAWCDFPPTGKLTGRAKKLGFTGSWRSSSLKPARAVKREHAALVRAKLAD